MTILRFGEFSLSEAASVKLTANAVKDKLEEGGAFVDTLSKSGDTYTARKEFFFTHGKTSKQVADTIKIAVEKFAGKDSFELVSDQEVRKPFRGGGSTAQNSHWLVKFKIKEKTKEKWLDTDIDKSHVSGRMSEDVMINENLKIVNDSSLADIAKYMVSMVKKHSWDFKDLIVHFENDNDFNYKLRPQYDSALYSHNKITSDSAKAFLEKIVDANGRSVDEAVSQQELDDNDCRTLEDYYELIWDNKVNGNIKDARQMIANLSYEQTKGLSDLVKKYARTSSSTIVTWFENEIEKHLNQEYK